MKEIRDAVDWCYKNLERSCGDEIKPLIDLAEKVLAVEGKMPEISNEPAFYCPMEILSHAEYKGRKEAIEQCTLAITEALLSVEELEKITNEYLDNPREVHMNWRHVLCKKLHSVQMEKLGGE